MQLCKIYEIIDNTTNMAAGDTSSGRPSWETFVQCANSICDVFKVSSFYENQLRALYNFICGEDVFVNLPTGYGKSLIYQMAPLVHSWMHKNISKFCWKKDPILLIISPSTTLMQDQVNMLTSLGLKAAFVTSDQQPNITKEIEAGKFMFVFISPESTLESFRYIFESDMYKTNLIGIAVDEVHCVAQWGTSNNNKKKSAFRSWYSRLNEIRSMVNDLPFIALTATATEQTKQKIFEILEFETPVQICECPNKANIRYSAQKIDNSEPIIENFKSVINELIKKGKDSTRRIIYCQTVKQCSHLFRMFELELESHLCYGEVAPCNRLVEMMHSGSPSTVKSHVLDQFGDSAKHLRILIATIAYGMGLDCKGVTQVIHFCPSQKIESYMQESGRCRRKGEQSDALLL